MTHTLVILKLIPTATSGESFFKYKGKCSCFMGCQNLYVTISGSQRPELGAAIPHFSVRLRGAIGVSQ
jgi:hypothetical protein